MKFISNQFFSKIWIVVILVILVAGGFLAWQYRKVPKEEIPKVGVLEKEAETPKEGEPTVTPKKEAETPKEGEPTVTPTSEGQIIVKQSGGAGLLIPECGDKSYITETADYIVEGVVEKVESKSNQEKTSIFTYTDLQIKKYVKGSPFPENSLLIVTPGGTVGEITLWVEDQPIFHQDKEIRIYFQATNGEFSIVCAQFGVEEI